MLFAGGGILSTPINTLRPIQNGHHFTDDIFNVLMEIIKMSSKCVPRGFINNIPA